jgi:hypothetical protein
MKLRPLPLPRTTGVQGIFAQRRKGKSHTAQTQAEDRLEAATQIAVFDPTAAWWGLRSSADGRSPGYPVTIFGGEHGDAPLEVDSGALIAAAMVSERFSAVLDVSLLDPDEWPIVGGDFLDTLYKLNRAPIHVYLDEVDQLAPQTTESKAQQRSRRVVNRIVRLGGIRGIGTTVITQRTAVLDKSILSQCDTYTVLQMNGARDLKALRDELANHASREVVDEVIASLGSLPIGEAWSLTPNEKSFERVKVRAKRTFNSGRTPEDGDVPAPPKALAPVDVARLGKAIAATVAKAKENDPKALRARVAELEAELRRRESAPPVVVEPRYSDRDVEAMLLAIVEDGQLAQALLMRGRGQESPMSPSARVKSAAPMPPTSPSARAKSAAPTPPAARRTDAADRKEPPPLGHDRDILVGAATLLALDIDVTIASLAAWCGVHPKNKRFLQTIGELREQGMLDGLGLTAEGAAVAKASRPNDLELQAILSGGLTEQQRAILNTLATFRRDIVLTPTLQRLALWMGLHPKNKAFLEDVGNLRTRGYLKGYELTQLGALASRPLLQRTNGELLDQFANGQRAILDAVLGDVVMVNTSTLAERVGVHPKNKAFLEDLGKLRDRGLVTKGWPLVATEVFA